MCLIAFAVGAHPLYGLVVAANRDEFHARPTAPASFWNDAPRLLAGRDLVAGGTWLGVTAGGRFAALTNFRDPTNFRADAPSRGSLVADYLTGDPSPAAYLTALDEHSGDFNGFNIVVGDRADTFCYSNRDRRVRCLAPGVYGLSNHLLDTPWPKVLRTKDRLETLLALPDFDVSDLLGILDDRRRAPDPQLPRTGISVEWERLLSSPCIVSPTYGTRSSTALLVDNSRHVTFVEQTRGSDGSVTRTRDLRFPLVQEHPHQPRR